MGLLSLVQEKLGGVQRGQTTLTTDMALGVDADAITPDQHGEIGITRTLPWLKKADYQNATVAQANQLKRKVAELKIRGQAAIESMNALKEAAETDTRVHKTFNNLRKTYADSTYQQVKSNASYVRHVAGYQAKYAGLHESTDHVLELQKAKNDAIGTKTQQFSQLW